MNQTLRAIYIKRLHEQVGALGPQFELFAGRFLGFASGLVFDNRGLSLSGQPVGGAVDGVSTCGTLAWEASAEAGYFKGRKTKFWGDLRHAYEQHGGARRIVLLAGATMATGWQAALMRVVRRLQKYFGKELELLDARAIATNLVDMMLDNDLAVESLSVYLPALREIQEENGWSHGIPRLAANYLPRRIEAELEADLEAHAIATVAGIGGAGKSQICAAIAKRATSQYDSVIWLDAGGLGDLKNLENHAVNRSGNPRNILALLKRRRCLLVLDDLRIEAPSDRLKELAGTSHILVSRRTFANQGRVVPPLDEGEARALLSHGIVAACPEGVFRRLWGAIGGHPLSLALLNATANGGTTWEELGEDADMIGAFTDEKEQRLADRLLARVARAIATEIGLFRWCQTPACDRAFAKSVIGNVGIRKLHEFCLLAAHDGHVLRLHDVVFSAIQQLDAAADWADFRVQLASYIRDSAHDDDDALAVLARTHVAKLAKLIQEGSAQPEFRYAWAIGAEARQVNPDLIGDPLAMAEACKSADSQALSISVDAVLESVEALYRQTKEVEGLDAAKHALEGRLAVFDVLETATAAAPPELRARVSHHRGKALKLLNRATEALAVFEGLLSGSSAPHAARLQVIRLSIKTNPARSERLIRDVLDASRNKPGEVSASVALAVVREIRRLGKPERTRLLDEYGVHIADKIRGTVRSHPDESLGAFAAVAAHWVWNDPQRFVALWRSLPPAEPQAFERDDGRAAYADAIGEAAARIALSTAECQQLQEDALALYDGLERPSAYNLRNRGKLLFQMGRLDDAVRQLEAINDPSGEAWVRYWLSKARLSLGNAEDALAEVDRAISLLKHPVDFRAAFLSQRAACYGSLRDARALQDASDAISFCQDDRHRKLLEADLVQLQTELGPAPVTA